MPGRQASAGSGPLRFLPVAGLPEPAVGRAARRRADLTPLARAFTDTVGAMCAR
ncbi:hypothetical protein [Streptomyces sp. NPDC093260]|uniref:hypothetical protein n=1 Tax=Streptomyces sp. NPDC093260 TaxID=3155073 RepID=UPI003412C1A7